VSRPAAGDTTVAPRGFATLAGALAALPEARILDVRDEEAFAGGHIEGSGRISREEFGPRRAELPAREAPVLVVHESAARALDAAEALAAMGYTHAAWLDRPLGE
jgi:rhodanese-related sulfurtransferase